MKKAWHIQKWKQRIGLECSDHTYIRYPTRKPTPWQNVWAPSALSHPDQASLVLPASVKSDALSNIETTCQ